jgi:membrane fusion protein (multidrug efflux system)
MKNEKYISGRKFINLIIIIAITIGSMNCKSNKSNTSSTSRQGSSVLNIEGYVVKPSSLDLTITITGTLKPLEETTLMPEVAGRVVKINILEGKFVKQGTLLIKLFDDDLQAQLHKSEAQLQIAEQTQARQSELVKVNGISQSDYDQSVLQVNSIKADIEVLKVQIRKTEVIAPFDGVIGLRNISLGAEVTPATSLATIRAENQLKLDFSVSEKYSSQVKAGDLVQFEIQGDNKKYDAVVIATEEGIDATTRNLKVRALVNLKNASLVPGAFADVDLRLNENKNALMVPAQAIIPTDRDKQLIVAKSGKAKFVSVITDIRQDSLVEVVKGIKPGDTIVTTGILFIKPGTALKFSKISK